jgi:outer membrane immunogenic protein
MHRFGRAALAAVAVIGFASIGSAADMPVKAPAVAAPLPYNWTGCYLGGNVGGAWQNNSSIDAIALIPTGSDRGNSFIGGAQVGCDYQFASNWVIGIQGMFDWTGINSSHLFTGSPTETLGVNTKSIYTLTGRIGYTIRPEMLLYFKGGAAWARIDYSDFNPAGNTPFLGQASVTRSGWTVGGGIEYTFLRNWSAFAEYDYIDLGSRNVSLTYNCGTTAQCGFQNPYPYTQSHNISEFLVGINYRFGPLAGR